MRRVWLYVGALAGVLLINAVGVVLMGREPLSPSEVLIISFVGAWVGE